VWHNFQECARAPLGPQPNGLREPPGSTNAIKPMTGRQACECFKHRASLPRGPSKQTWPTASRGPVPGGRTGKQTCFCLFVVAGHADTRTRPGRLFFIQNLEFLSTAGLGGSCVLHSCLLEGVQKSGRRTRAMFGL
jgi:hypothetical protein